MSVIRFQRIQEYFDFQKEVWTVSLLRSIRKAYQFFVDVPFKAETVLNNRYEVLRVIGTGSYGIVYLCKDLKSEENRVVKQLRPSKRRKKKEVELFERETSILRTLQHKNMPTFYEAFSSDGSLFYVMSFIEWDNLEDQIFSNKKTFNENESLVFLEKLLEIIDYLHQKNIFHQDLRIPNILVKNNEPFLIDFGLSKQRVSVAPIQKPSSIRLSKLEGTLEMKQQDYYDLGEVLLYLLYTTYSSKKKKALPWTEELSLEKETVYLLQRLLQLKDSYSTCSGILADLRTAIKATEKLH